MCIRDRHIVATVRTHKVGANPFADGHMVDKARVGVKLPTEYLTPCLKSAIQRLLCIEPEGRPEMSADPNNGFLQTAEEFKRCRGRMLEYKGPISNKVWRCPPEKTM